MFSVVEQGGVQFKIAEGDTISVPLMDIEPGNEVDLEKVLLVSDDGGVRIGTPIVDGVSVKANVVKHFKDDKVLVIKRKRRKDYRRKNGHRQQYTELKITSISA